VGPSIETSARASPLAPLLPPSPLAPLDPLEPLAPLDPVAPALPLVPLAPLVPLEPPGDESLVEPQAATATSADSGPAAPSVLKSRRTWPP
jgi:hypothetical protein